MLYLTIAIITFVSRIVPRLIRRETLTSDTYYHLYRAELIRQNKFKLPLHDRQLKAFGGIYYPPLYHYALALFPRRWRYQAEKYLGPCCDTLLVVIALRFAHIILPGTISQSGLFYLGCAIALNPLFTYCGNGPRVYGGTARIVGQLFFYCSIVGLLLYLQGGNSKYLLLFIGSGALVLLTSRFGVQAWIVAVLGIALFSGVSLILIYALLSGLTALLITKGSYVRILKAHINHLYNHIVHAKSIDGVLLKRSKEWKYLSHKEGLKQLLFHDYYFIYSTRNIGFIALATVAVLLGLKGGIVATESLYPLWGWVLSLQVASFLTSRKKLLFLGEAERYLEYAAVPVLIMLTQYMVYLAPNNVEMLLVIAVYGYCVPYYLAQLFIYVQWHKEYSGGQDYDHVIDKLNTMQNLVILPIIRDQPWRTAYLTQHMIACMPKDERSAQGREDLSAFYLLYPWPHTDLKRYMRDHSVNTVVTEKRLLKALSARGIHYDLAGYEKVYDNNRYEIYQHRQCNDNAAVGGLI